MFARMRFAAAVLFLLLLPSANALFLVGEAEAGQPTSILCEGQESVFVSTPSGATRQLPLDSSFQAQFTPETSGSHTLQCGNLTKTINVKPAMETAGAAKETPESGMLLLALAVAFVAFSTAALILVARQLIFRRTSFSKVVEGGTARLSLRCGKRLSAIRISDPVAMEFAGKEMAFEIPALGAGKGWEWEYEIDDPARALPASLEALCDGKKISMLSEIHILGGGLPARQESEGGKKKEAERGMKRKLPKAD